MKVILIAPYLIALAGLVIGSVVGLVLAAARTRKSSGASPVSERDARITLPLLLGAAGAHLVLIPQVEPERQILFALYGIALVGVGVFATAGISIWRAGAILFPLGSILAYVYFAVLVHQVDYVGLLVKLVEVAAIAAAVSPLLTPTRLGSKRSNLAG